MRYFLTAAGFVAACLVAYVAGASRARTVPAPAVVTQPQPSQRYYIIPFENASAVLLDMETGQCWQRGFTGWQDWGSPSK